ncbi:MAG: hypothetical protein NTZ09_06995 [Candidatus Hydrogenedentes bacterium]|nr:hypothetical protein [Candidatus Hydrogenedentota bacterium]
MDDLERIGFNWIRVWATWNAFGNDISVLTADGAPNKTCLDRLTRLCELAGKRGMVVDVTVSRGKDERFPHDLTSHLAVTEQLARTLKPYRNVYLDLGNGRPRRSFDMRRGEGRLFEQLDAEELRFLKLVEKHPNTRGHWLAGLRMTGFDFGFA